jgi:hypothetical protein
MCKTSREMAMQMVKPIEMVRISGIAREYGSRQICCKRLGEGISGEPGPTGDRMNCFAGGEG